MSAGVIGVILGVVLGGAAGYALGVNVGIEAFKRFLIRAFDTLDDEDALFRRRDQGDRQRRGGLTWDS